ncbi:MAG: hypothetical protein QOF49_2398 [Chloroflexota bacterium]|jgi:hypothetical protein|nr:hypothetical protein [Chloroflexota bacterium]
MPDDGVFAEETSLEAAGDRLLAGHPPGIQAIARALRATVRDEFSDAIEQVDMSDGLIAFGRSTKIRGLVFAIIPHASWVNLQLADGVDLPDPEGLIEGTGKRIRHVKVRTVEAASAAPLLQIVRAQLAVRP